jgi:branched-subunit amino acid transport protein AzlD
MSTASIITDFWNRIAEHNLQGLYLVLIGFVLSFAFIRMSTRLMRSPKVPWWPGSIVSDSGVHLHHLVFGIVTMMAAGAGGFAAFGNSPWTEICAFAFGVGAGLTIDEFALWVYLDDVYWAKEGRSSIDATVIAAALMLLALLGFTPFTIEEGSVEAVLGTAVSALVVFLLVAICFAKGRILHGTIGFFVFPVALYGACHLGKPGSAWARRRYGERRPQKQTRSEERFPPERRTERFKEAFRDVVGGKPSEGLAAAKEEAFAATREASEEVRQRAERVTHPGDGES